MSHTYVVTIIIKVPSETTTTLQRYVKPKTNVKKLDEHSPLTRAVVDARSLVSWGGGNTPTTIVATLI